MKKLLTSLLAAAALTGCSPYTLVDSQVYNGAELSDYRTFRIVTPDDGNLPPGMEMVTYYNIAAAVREQMVERGYTEDPDSPLLINLGLTVRKEIATEPLAALMPPPGPPVPPPAPVGPPPGPGGPGGPGTPPPPPPHYGPVYNGLTPYFMYPRGWYWNNWNYYNSNAQVITGIYKEGVLTMDIVNIRQKLPIYTASVATILSNGDSQFRNLKGIAEAVQTLFSKFPVPIPKNR